MIFVKHHPLSGASYHPDFSSGQFAIPIDVEMRGTGDFMKCSKMVKIKKMMIFLVFVVVR
jgi:hypothetical protein